MAYRWAHKFNRSLGIQPINPTEINLHLGGNLQLRIGRYENQLAIWFYLKLDYEKPHQTIMYLLIVVFLTKDIVPSQNSLLVHKMEVFSAFVV